METIFSTTENGSLNYISQNNYSVKKKILFACVPADGHFNPLTPLAVYLKEQGHDVRWYTSTTYAEKIAKLQIKHYPLKRAFDLAGGSPEELFPERNKIHNKVKKLVFDLINGFILRAPEYFQDIKEIHKSFPFDVVIADCMFFAIPIIKHKLNVPVISIGVLPLTESSKDIAPPGLGLTPPSNFLQKGKYAVLKAITSFLFKKPVKLFSSLLNKYGINMREPNLFDFVTHESSLLLQIGVPGFEYKRSDMGKNIRFIGAALPDFKGEKKWHHPKLAQYTKVLLVTQGTVEKDISKLLIPTLEAFKNSEYLVIATTGGSHTEDLRNYYNYDNIIIEDFIPFNEVMPHAHVYITNGGYGGVMISIQNKLPMVVAGVHEGKNEITARVGYFKAGINLRTEKPIPSQIKAAVQKIFTDNTYQSNIEKISNELAGYNANELCAHYINQVLSSKYQRLFN